MGDSNTLDQLKSIVGDASGPKFIDNLTSLSVADQSTYLAWFMSYLEQQADQATPRTVNQVVAQLQQTKWTDVHSVDQLTAYILADSSPLLPFATAGGQQYLLLLAPNELSPAVQDDGINPVVSPPTVFTELELSFFLTGIKVDGQPNAPKFFYALGPLVTQSSVQIDNDTATDIVRTGFVVAVNVLDGSLWLIYNFCPMDQLTGLRHNLGSSEPWGTLANVPGSPFSMAKVADGIANSGLAKQPASINLVGPIQGGPGILHVVSVSSADLNKVVVPLRPSSPAAAA